MRKTLLLSSLLPLGLVFGVEWNVDASGLWNTPGNWTTTTVPNSPGVAAVFGNVITADRTVTLDISPAVGSLNFISIPPSSYTIAGSGTNAITMNNAPNNVNAEITMFAGTDAATITAPLVLTSSLTIGQLSTVNLLLQGVISGGGSITLSGGGSGIVALSAGNTFSGGLTISGSTLQCGAVNTLPTTLAVTLSGGTLDLNSFAQTIRSLSGTTNVSLGTAVLTVSTTGASSYGGVISGGGALVVSGTGSLTLSGVNTYNGGTTVSGGSLILGASNRLNTAGALTVTSPGIFNLNNFSQTVSSLAGSGSVTLGSGALTISGNSPTIFSGVISGTGSFTHSGTAITTFSGANTYTGGTTISSGTLLLGANNSLPSTGAVDITGTGVLDLNNFSQTVGTLSSAAGGTLTLGSGTLTVAPSADANFAGALTGTGSVIFQGPFTWTYQVNQKTYTGGTTINGGTLKMGLANALASTGPVTVNSPGTLSLDSNALIIRSLAGSGTVSLGNASLTLNTTGTTTFSGSITGTGDLRVNGTGTQILTGTNTYSGGTSVDVNATLQGTTSSLQGAIDNDGLLFFDQPFAGTYSGPLTGTGDLRIGGGGTVTLTGTPTQGTAHIVDATLVIPSGTNLTATTVTIASAGTLAGSGTITSNVSNAGTIDPSSPLTVIGNVTFQPGSSFVVDLTPTTSDQLLVQGSVTINNGSQVIVQAAPGSYAAETRYLIITSTSAVSGQFQGIQQANPFLSVNLLYNQILPGSVELDLTIRPIGDVIQGGNAGAIAKCLTTANLQQDSDLEQLVAELIFFPVEEVRKILDQMQPSQLRALTVAEQNNTLFAQQMISWRTAELDRTQCERDIIECHPGNFWLSLGGNWTEQRPDDHNIGYQAPAVGLIAGFDGKIAHNTLLGVALEYGHTGLSWKENRGSSKINRMSVGPYLNWVGRFGYLNASVLASLAHFDTTRKIPHFEREAESSHHGETVLTHLDGGIVVRPASGVTLTPFVMGDLLFGWEDGYRETGAESLNFTIASSSSTLLRTELGLRIAKCAVRSHTKWVHDIKASWVHEARFHGKDLHATFREVPCGFTVEGLYPSRSLLDVGMGLAYLFKKDKNAVSLRYEGQFGEGVSIQSGIVQLITRF